MQYRHSLHFAQTLDQNDKLAHFRKKFFIPNQKSGEPYIYLCGNSLGCQPKTVREHIEQELLDWKNLGVEGHFHGKNPWFYYHHFVNEVSAKLVGAKPNEVVIMNSLTVNLHLMMVSFYRPTATRYKIMVEADAFPSDHYAVQSQAKMHGFNPDDAIIQLYPREGEHTLRTEDIVAKIEMYGDELALVMLGGVNYYTGQLFDMATITDAAHVVGAKCGFDLAHAAGNVPLNLHDWEVDFAVWCSYKYLNSGPGGTSGAYVHEKHCNNPDLIRMAGWWGNDEKTRFLMEKKFVPQAGAAGWQLSNAQVLPMAAYKASLEIFAEAGIENLRKKSLKMTGFLEFLLEEINNDPKNNTSFKIITPKGTDERGCQLSILTDETGKATFERLTEAGVIADWREPNVIRVAPVPLYNTFEEVYRFAELMRG